MWFFWLFSICFAASVMRSLAFWLSFLQRKQYRIDRLWQAAKAPAFWKLYASPYRLGLITVFIAWQITVRLLQLPIWFDALSIAALLIFAGYAAVGLVHILRGNLEQPILTPKAVILALTLFIVELALLRLPWIGTPQAWSWQIVSPEQALLMEIVQPYLVFGIFALLFLPNTLLHRQLLSRAAAKRRGLPGLKVVGITGSYGKTTMKEFVAHLLQTQGLVLKTPAHVNVDTGVAKQILRELSPHHAWYVVEMGAYRPNEIKSLCDLTMPTHGILTALSNQHLELFGTLDRLRDAKFELVQAVNNPDHLIMNGDSRPLREACRQKGIEPVWFGLHADDALLQPKQIAFTEQGTEFVLEGTRVSLRGFGRARLTNALGALTFCRQAGLPMQTLASACATMPDIEHTMSVKNGRNGCLVIDATYNANTQGVLQAVEDLELVSRQHRMILFKDIIELGQDAMEDHRTIADAFARSKAEIVLLPSSYTAVLRERLQTTQTRILDVARPELILERITKDTVILCLGRDTQAFMETHLL